jgi:PAS domain S-box-containing protein
MARQVGFEKAGQLSGLRLKDLAFMSTSSTEEATARFIRSGYRFSRAETTPVDHEGKRRYVLRSQWGIVENGYLQRVWGTTRDITEVRALEHALDASERRMADLLETLRLVVLILHEDGTIAFCNKHLYGLTGWSPEDVVGGNYLDLMVPLEEQGKIRAAFASAKSEPDIPTHYEGTLLGPKGRRWWIAWDCTGLRDSAGAFFASAIVGRDISEYKNLEAQFRQAQKLESIGRLAGGLAHDFNNLLTVIMGYSALLLEQSEPSDPSHTGLVEIRKAAQKGADLTYRLMAFSRRQVHRPELLNLAALIADDEQMIRRLIGEDVRLITNLSSSLDLVRADASQIQQVLLNLIVNARDAMPDGGTLIVSTSNYEISGPESSSWAGASPGRYVLLTVTDTGIGMTEEIRAQVFEPFFTTKEHGKGTGLGLSTVYGIVQQTGGHIEVESEPGKGACFRILLPGILPDGAPETPPFSAEAMPRGTETILLVEDQEEVRVLAATVLRGLGYRVLEAEGAERALQLAAENSIDLLLTDVVMPGSSGRALAGTVKASYPGTKALFMSGYSDLPPDLQDSAEPGFVCLLKPFVPSALACRVREILDQR